MNIKDIIAILARYLAAIFAGWLVKMGIDQGTVDSWAPGIGLAVITLLWGFYSFARAKNLLPTWLTDAKIIETAKEIQNGKMTVEDVPGQLTATAPKDPYIGHGQSGNTL